jgi:hypothetical protein
MKRFILVIAGLLSLTAINSFATYDSSFGGQKFDEETHGLITIDAVHWMVHRGYMFEVGTSTAVLANGTTASFLINLTSATITNELHLVFNASLGGQGKIDIYENAIYNSSGTALTAYNMDRTTTNVCQAGIIFSANPLEITTLGTKIYTTLSPGGTSVQTRIGGSTRAATEWILKPGNSYSVVITNSSGGNIAVSLSLEFYEVE